MLISVLKLPSCGLGGVDELLHRSKDEREKSEKMFPPVEKTAASRLQY